MNLRQEKGAQKLGIGRDVRESRGKKKRDSKEEF